MIPRIIHQTWKTHCPPRQLRSWQATWIQHHPEWEYRLWTDEDNRALIEQHYAWFLPLYDSYPEHIMRVDAARYFILDYHGGVYADLDFECLRPMDALLANKRLVLGREPPANVAHVLSGKVAREHTGDLIGNAWIASEARHPFWAHAHKALVETHGGNDTLETTGPFFLTRALRAFDDDGSVTVESHEVLYPIGSREAERESRGATTADMARAYAVHHWRGTWWRRQRVTRRITWLLSIVGGVARRAREWSRDIGMMLNPNACERYRAAWGMRQSARVTVPGGVGRGRMWAQVIKHGACVARAVIETDDDANRGGNAVCCVARASRFCGAQTLRAAVDDFHRQTIPNKCLVLLTDHADERVNEHARELATTNDVADVVTVATGEETFARMRQAATDAIGMTPDAWARWGGYASHPRRLATQLTAIRALDADLCLLQRRLLLSPQRVDLSAGDALSDTLMCAAAQASHVAWETWSDGNEALPLEAKTVLLDEPLLSVVMSESMEGVMTWQGERYDMLARYLHRLYGDALPLLADEAGVLHHSGHNGHSRQADVSPTATAEDSDKDFDPDTEPCVLILTPVKNAASHITRYVENLRRIDYPKEKISLAFLESDSEDGTWEHLNLVLPELHECYPRVELFQKHFGYRAGATRWAMNEQFRRRSIMARSRNTLLSRALRDEQWVLWMDADLLSWPPDALTRLLSAGKDIVVPNCVKEDGTPFDMNTFQLTDDAAQLDWSRYVYDGILQPPVGYGRTYLGAHHGLTEVDGVGGTMLLVRADLHREGLNFPAYPHRYLIETEGLAQVAKEMGHQCWGLADLTIVHVSR